MKKIVITLLFFSACGTTEVVSDVVQVEEDTTTTTTFSLTPLSIGNNINNNAKNFISSSHSVGYVGH